MDFYEIKSLDDLKEGYFHVLEPISNDYVKPEEIDSIEEGRKEDFEDILKAIDAFEFFDSRKMEI